jgi:hypothetical protein
MIYIRRQYMGKKLFLIKLVHTIIWFFYVCIIVYIFFAAIYNKIDYYLWVAIGLVVLEGLVLLVFKGKCPLTVIGYKYSENQDVGFDIFIPAWLAKNNKLIFTTLFVLGIIIVLYRVLGL